MCKPTLQVLLLLAEKQLLKSDKALGFGKVRNAMTNHNAFVFAVTANKNAANCRIDLVEIDFPPVAEIIRASSEIFRSIDRDDEFQCEIARTVWMLKTTSILTVLPFDDERLRMMALLESLEKSVDSVPEISDSVKTLRNVVSQLISASTNPKRTHLLSVIENVSEHHKRIALVANLHGLSTPGWPQDMKADEILLSAGIDVVRTRKEISDVFFDSIVIPGNPRFAPRKFLFDLLYGGRTRNITVLGYRAENIWIPSPANMPKSDIFNNTRSSTHIEKTVTVDRPENAELIDKWANDSFWSSLRRQHADSVPKSDRDARVRVRFVLFADGSGAFLPEDGRVVEISGRFDLGRELDIKEERLPRKSVADLEEGDLVMMRLSGSGDYLDDVANDLMVQAGDGDLRTRALEWKDWLYRTLKHQGEGVLAKKLKELDLTVRSPQYLWAWASDAVMAPHDYDTFSKLMNGLNALEPSYFGSEIDDYIGAKWTDMELVKSFQQRAGMTIRSALIKRVQDLIKRRQRVDTVQTIELVGVKAGMMGLMRVSAVDSKSMMMPLSRLFHLEKIEHS